MQDRIGLVKRRRRGHFTKTLEKTTGQRLRSSKKTRTKRKAPPKKRQRGGKFDIQKTGLENQEWNFILILHLRRNVINSLDQAHF